MSTYPYDVWHVRVPSERIHAMTGFEARKEFAAKHGKQVSECMARRIYAASSKPEEVNIRSEP